MPVADDSSPQSLHPRQAKLQRAIESVLQIRPFWRAEGIRINGRNGMAALLRRRGMNRTATTIRSALKRMGLKTVGFGMIGDGLPSRERLTSIVREIAEARPEWKTGYIKVRGKTGMKSALIEKGYRVNQVLIHRAIVDAGLNTMPRGLPNPAVLVTASHREGVPQELAAPATPSLSAQEDAA